MRRASRICSQLAGCRRRSEVSLEMPSNLPALGSLGALVAAAWKSPELLKEIYGDLAKPGVAQVGRALGTVIETGALALLPLRLANSAARAWEQRTFEQIAERFSSIEEGQVDSIRPELAVPILESLQFTSDETIRSLFIELLASGSDKAYSETCHPSFVHIIKNLSPDEGKILTEWNGKSAVPFLDIWMRVGKSRRKRLNNVMDIPKSLNLSQNINVYISNMTGLGLIKRTTSQWLDEKNYESHVKYADSKWPGIKQSNVQKFDMATEVDGQIFYECGMISIEPYGTLFQRACLAKPD